MKKNIIIIYRIFFVILAFLIIEKLVILGDYQRYIKGNFYEIYQVYGLKFLLNSTALTDFLIGILRRFFFNNKLITIFFINILGSYGIIYFFRATSWNKNIYFFILMPSFCIWSSYPSKEVIVVFITGIIMGNLIYILENKNRKKKDKFLFWLSIYLLYIYKKQYLISILFIVIYIFLKDKINLKTRRMIYILYIIFLILILFLLRNKIDSFLINFHEHFDYGSKETVRNLTIFREQYGFLKHLPYGIFICFFGPSFNEIFQGGLKLCSFIESFIIIIGIFYCILKNKNIGLERLFLFFNGMFLLLLPQYPFGVFNSGSAIRYRTNLYLIFLGLLYIFILRKRR